MRNQKNSFDLDNMLNEIKEDDIQIPENLSVNTHRLLLKETNESKISSVFLGVIIAISFLVMISSISIIIFSALSGKVVFVQMLIGSIISQIVASIVIFIFKDELFKKLIY